MTAPPAAPAAGYRAVIRSPRWGFLAACTVGARLPVAMAPLALILAGYHVGGGAAAGGLLVAGHTIGEVIAASPAGAAMDRWTPRRGLGAGLAAEAALFTVLAVLVARDAPLILLTIVATLAGAVPAGAPGGLRTALSDTVQVEALAPALGVDSIINQASWASAPILVSALVAVGSAPVALAVIAAVAGFGSLAALGLAAPAPVDANAAKGGRLGPLLRVLGRPLLLTAVWRLVFGVLTVAAVPLLTSVDSGSLSGVALSAYAGGAAVGGLAYGARRRGGSPEVTADTAMLVLGLVLLTAPLADSLATVLVLYAVAGLVEGPIVVARSLQLERLMPAGRRATGFSLQYAAIGLGFGAAGVLLAPLIPGSGTTVVISGTGVVVALVAAAALLTRRRGADG
jgi:hypothetical protein